MQCLFLLDCPKLCFNIKVANMRQYNRNYFYIADSTEELSFPLARSISKKLAVGNTFYDIGLQLGLSEEDIKIIMSDNKNSVLEQAYETLKKWKQLKASEATVLRILDVLLKLRLYDIASTLCDHYDRDVYNMRTQRNISQQNHCSTIP